MKTTLLIMAAGIGSRFGGGIKQLATVDAMGHIIMDYSIHDAIAAGFDRIIFVIRKDIEQDFRTVIGDRIEALCRERNVQIAYAYQDLTDLPQGYKLPEDRVKPWGTGHAVLAARELIGEPFAVINADDYYGREAFQKLHDFLVSGVSDRHYCMAGFVLRNTLSKNGAVTRGICQVTPEGYLANVQETSGICQTPEGIVAGDKRLDADAVVSMNMWGFAPDFIPELEKGFRRFLDTAMKEKLTQAEFLIPVYVGKQLSDGKIDVKVLPTGDKWLGVTYQEDRETVTAGIRELIQSGVYRADLYSDV